MNQVVKPGRMTRRDFERIAWAIANARKTCSNQEEQSGINRVVSWIANTLEDDYPRFDFERFVTACGNQWEGMPLSPKEKE